jgi:subtilase family serine protease
VVGFDDALDGSTVTEIAGMALGMAPDGSDLVAFGARLADGRSGVFLATPAPDLRVTALEDPPATAAPGDTIAFAATTANEGTASAPRTRTRFVLSADGTLDPGDTLLAAVHRVPALDPGSESRRTVRAKIPDTTRPRDYRLFACADHADKAAEGDESNNCTLAAATMHLTGPDLVQASVEDPPLALPANRQLTVVETVRNEGDGLARRSSSKFFLTLTGLRADARALSGSRTVPALGPAGESPGSTVVKVPAGTPPGDYFLLACSDDANKVVEISDTNNCKASSGTMTVP